MRKSRLSFKVGDRVIRGTLIGTIDHITNDEKYTHHIVWQDGREDTYSDAPFRKGEILDYNFTDNESDLVDGWKYELKFPSGKIINRCFWDEKHREFRRGKGVVAIIPINDVAYFRNDSDPYDS